MYEGRRGIVVLRSALETAGPPFLTHVAVPSQHLAH